MAFVLDKQRSGMVTRIFKIQDGEDVDVLRRPGLLFVVLDDFII